METTTNVQKLNKTSFDYLKNKFVAQDLTQKLEQKQQFNKRGVVEPLTQPPLTLAIFCTPPPISAKPDFVSTEHLLCKLCLY